MTGDPNVFVAAMWRSGSTHIARGLGLITKFRPASTAGYHGEGIEQQDISPMHAAILFPYGYQVFHQHVWGTHRNVELLKAFKLRPIVCIRRIPDTILSIYERIHDLPRFVVPGLPMYKQWWDMDREAQFNWLAEVATPWQIQFYTTWKAANIDKKFVLFSDFYADQRKGFTGLLKWLDMMAYKNCDIEEAINANHNLKVGKVGRGRKMIPQSALDIIDRHLSAWKSPEMEKLLR
jgi:hypothetical protein